MKQYKVTVNGTVYEITLEAIDASEVKAAPATVAAPAPAAAPAAAPAPVAAAPAGGESVNAPMPGNILDIKVASGAIVKKGDVLIILICKVMGSFFAKTNKAEETSAAVVAAAPVAQNTVIENRQEIIAAVAAVIAEELGTEVEALKIHSFKKI